MTWRWPATTTRPLGCHGPPWRDVNGDGESGFDPEGAVRTRDELQARLDLANVVRADVLVSIHINSLTAERRRLRDRRHRDLLYR